MCFGGGSPPSDMDAGTPRDAGGPVAGCPPLDGHLRVTVRYQYGTDHPVLDQAEVDVRGPGSDSGGGIQTTGASGAVTFRDLRPGRYNIRVTRTGASDGEANATVTSDTTTQAEVILTPIGTLQGRVVDNSTGDAISGATVSIVGRRDSATTDAQGQFRFPNLSAGRYQIRASKQAYVNNTTNVDARFRPGGTMNIDIRLRLVRVEIEINNTATTSDDFMQVKTTNPAARHRVSCRAKLLDTNTPSDVNVVLTNPDGRLRLPGDSDTNRNLTIATSGAWSAFEISGETVSAAVGDAVIEARLDSRTGRVLGNKGTTVFTGVEIQVNNTPATNDDIVQLKCERPANRYRISCRARVVGIVPGNVNVVLTNSDSRLRFPDNADTTKNLALASGGAWSAFEISGETRSNARNDAKIEARLNSATGYLLGNGGSDTGSRDVTVFWFDQAQINITPGGSYTLTGGQYTATGGNGVNFSARARIRPAGVDCSVPQVSNLRVGIMQNNSSGSRTVTWGTPTITWNVGVAVGTVVTVPATIRTTITVSHRTNDSETSVAPLYDQPGKTRTWDANSLKPPVGCPRSGSATSRDTPAARAGNGIVPARTAAGAIVGTISYSLVNVTINDSFTTWAIIFNTSTNNICTLRERTWNLNVNSAAAGAQRATAAAADADPTTTPLTGAPYSNNELVNAANLSIAPVGAAVTTFTR